MAGREENLLSLTLYARNVAKREYLFQRNFYLLGSAVTVGMKMRFISARCAELSMMIMAAVRASVTAVCPERIELKQRRI